jgi:hypothetical protein
MKPTSTFKLSGSTKRLLATFPDAHARGHYKRMMIDAQLAAEVKISTKDKKD